MSVQKNKSTNNNNAMIGLIVRYVFSLGCSVLFCWLLLCVIAKIMCATDIPADWIAPITSCCGAVAMMAAAMLCTKKVGSNGVIWGGALAFGGWAILCICSLINGQTFTTLALLKLFVFCCAGMIGGISGVFLHEKRKKKMRR